MFLLASLRIFVCHRTFGVIRSKSVSISMRSQFGSFSSISLTPSTQFRSSIISFSELRNFASSSKSNGDLSSHSHAKSTVATTSKRGPKYRTPSKMKDASAALGVKETIESQKKDHRLDWNIWAYATAEEYRMEKMSQRLKEENTYEVSVIAEDLPDVFRLTPRSNDAVSFGRREIFVFSNGAVVFWDVPLPERRNFLLSLHPFEQKPYEKTLVEEECERLTYVLHEYGKDESGTTDGSGQTHGNRHGRFRKEVLRLDAAGKDDHWQLLERFTVSNVMAASVQLSMWESDFENLATTLEGVTDAMNMGKISLHKKRAISYAGRLTSLRHNVSLHSDLLDHPDFYWEREGLEKLYDQASQILCIRRRVNVFNKKLDDAMALIQIIMQELAVLHSSRLEWLIIYLIMIEVVFDAYHCWRTW